MCLNLSCTLVMSLVHCKHHQTCHECSGAMQDDDDDDVAVITELEAARLSTPSAPGSGQVIAWILIHISPQLLHTKSL